MKGVFPGAHSGVSFFDTYKLWELFREGVYPEIKLVFEGQTSGLLVDKLVDCELGKWTSNGRVYMAYSGFRPAQESGNLSQEPTQESGSPLRSEISTFRRRISALFQRPLRSWSVVNGQGEAHSGVGINRFPRRNSRVVSTPLW